jgi:hypothetical protein
MAALPVIVNGTHPTPRRKNDNPRGWVVQKFGGTSVGKFAGNIAEDIVRYVHPSLREKEIWKLMRKNDIERV